MVLSCNVAINSRWVSPEVWNRDSDYSIFRRPPSAVIDVHEPLKDLWAGPGGVQSGATEPWPNVRWPR